MRILMLSWEYPPRIIGGLSQHVYFLANALEQQGHEIHIVTCIPENKESEVIMDEVIGNIHIHRVQPIEVEGADFVEWVLQLNFAMLEECIRLINDGIVFHLVHGHDWLITYCAKSLKALYRIPIITTIHATEYGRNNGINTDTQRYIHNSEKYLTEISDKLIVCSNFMHDHTRRLFDIDSDRIVVIQNGVGKELKLDDNILAFRQQYAKKHEKLVFFIGRLVYEKGVQFLIRSIPKVIEVNPLTKFVIAGVGPMNDELKLLVHKIGISDRIVFVEHISERTKTMLFKAVDIAVFPSLYEPFGIVALEAMNHGCPTIVSNIGGFSEIIEDGVTGVKCDAGSPQSITNAINKLLLDKDFRLQLGNNGKQHVQKNYSWDKIAVSVVEVYKEIANL